VAVAVVIVVTVVATIRYPPESLTTFSLRDAKFSVNTLQCGKLHIVAPFSGYAL
jgi:hypothetical protein